MNLLALVPFPYRLLAIALLCLSLFGYGWIKGKEHVEHRVDEIRAKYDSLTQQLAQQKADATKKLAQETQRANDATARMQQAFNQQEHKDAQAKSTIGDLSNRVAAAERLRQQSAAGSGGGGSASAASTHPAVGAADATQTSGVLPAVVPGLAEKLREADELNAAYSSCRADALMLRNIGNP